MSTALLRQQGPSRSAKGRFFLLNLTLALFLLEVEALSS